jgi:murein L,D-transpeptidase YafK
VSSVLLLLALAPIVAGSGSYIGPWGRSYARYDQGVFGPERPLAQIADSLSLSRDAQGKLADARLLVMKAQRRCELWVGERMVKAYRIQLSQASRGTKARRGDQRTPEGEYFICAHRPSKYHRGLWISYPNLEDADRGVKARRITSEQREIIARAIDEGVCPPQNTKLGGFIMLHGQQRSQRTPRGAKPERTDLEPGDANPGSIKEYFDWTSGCIAMLNSDIRELHEMLADGTRVTIVADGPVTRPKKI